MTDSTSNSFVITRRIALGPTKPGPDDGLPPLTQSDAESLAVADDVIDCLGLQYSPEQEADIRKAVFNALPRRRE